MNLNINDERISKSRCAGLISGQAAIPTLNMPLIHDIISFYFREALKVHMCFHVLSFVL